MRRIEQQNGNKLKVFFFVLASSSFRLQIVFFSLSFSLFVFLLLTQLKWILWLLQRWPLVYCFFFLPITVSMASMQGKARVSWSKLGEKIDWRPINNLVSLSIVLYLFGICEEQSALTSQKPMNKLKNIHCSGLRTTVVVTVKRHADCIERLKVHKTKTNVLFRERIDSFVSHIRCGSFKFNCAEVDDATRMTKFVLSWATTRQKKISSNIYLYKFVWHIARIHRTASLNGNKMFALISSTGLLVCTKLHFTHSFDRSTFAHHLMVVWLRCTPLCQRHHWILLSLNAVACVCVMAENGCCQHDPGIHINRAHYY